MGEPRMPEPRMRNEFRRQLRARLMNEAVVVLAPRRRENAWRWLRPAMAVALAGIVLLAGAGSAAADSLPGDPAFGIKRALEEVRVTLTFDDLERVKVLADLTDKRLDELQRVAERADKAPTASEEYAQAVVRFRAAVDALRQAAPEEKRDKAQEVADSARDKHEAVLDEIQDRVPDQAKPALERARDEERKESGDREKGPKKSERPDRTPQPTRSPRVTATPTPRATERPETPRPTTPRPTGTPRPTEKND